MILLLAPTTSGTASAILRVGKGSGGHSESRPAAIFMPGLGAGEFGDIQFSVNGGSTWNNLYEDGAQVRLSNTNNVELIAGPGVYRVNKTATAAAVGCWAATPLSI